MMAAKLYGIGVGPGDPELLTLKAVRLLREVPVILVPYVHTPGTGLAWQVVRQFAESRQEIVEIQVPMSDSGGSAGSFWEAVAVRAMGILAGGSSCAYITLGDPGVYSSFYYLAQQVRALDERVPIEIVPGVSAISLLGTELQKPLAAGRESLAIVSGLNNPETLAQSLDQYDNLVVLKAAAMANSEKLSSRQACDPAYFACRLGMPGQKTGMWPQEWNPGDADYWTMLLFKKHREGL